MDEPTAALAVREVGKVLRHRAAPQGSWRIRDTNQYRLQDIFPVCDLIHGRDIMDEIVKYIVGAEAGHLSIIAGGR
ncbi:hypothetical protein [uncultured Enterovirga sp.]|uniref:hypothetical protein n=1 Tax=uncultured Enterovirga sp. TaxID=2026352 RepID=UPI0035CC16B5